MPARTCPTAPGSQSYDGIFLSGSHLHIYEIEPAVTRQIELMRAIYASGTPCFGSCWGIQIGAVAAGGTVTANPKGREVGFARKITPERGRADASAAARPPARLRRARHPSRHGRAAAGRDDDPRLQRL